MTRVGRILSLAFFIVSACDEGPTANPPAPSPTWPEDVFDGYPKDSAGRPVVMKVPTSFGRSLPIVLGEIDDPLTRWGHCISRVVGCYKTNEGRLSGCAPLIERCPDNRGGRGCCPPRCLDTFADLIASGRDEDVAVAEVFLDGTCVEGLAEQIAEVSP